MTVRELREKYIRFFEGKGHLLYPAASLIPYDVTGRLDESLLFTGAGMIQFKPYFRGVAQPENRRLTTCQRCVRTGDIDEVGDDSHLTFFEMLGNFSFGDYFKSQAIAFSWEFMTSAEWLGLDPRRLTFTVFEEDEEAFKEWAFWITSSGLDPASRIFRLGDETNYWPAGSFTKGPPGPCGPNSEMFYWVADEAPPSGPYTREDWLRDEAAGKWLEIWNDVFIQFEWQGSLRNPARPADGYVKEGMPPLPFQSIDTGMGLDRTAVVLGGYQSVYDTDVFEPIFAKIDSLSGSHLPSAGSEENLDRVRARRIIADHIRTAAFCIMDGILPSNNGRGYVLRRLIRRAVLKGQRTLQLEKPFFFEVFEAVVESMGDFYPELGEKREVIVETLRNEETLFRRTLSSGTEILRAALESVVEGGRVLAGDLAFKLYDTYGFPLEVTQEIAAEADVTVDIDGYEAALKEAQERSRAGTERESVYGGVTSSDELSVPDAEATVFTGYSDSENSARIVRVRPLSDGVLVALDRTPFYAESGGQTGDRGTLTLADGTVLEVSNTTKSGGVFWHYIGSTGVRATGLPGIPAPEEPGQGAQDTSTHHLEGYAPLLGQEVSATVWSSRRRQIQRNHTATHLLQAALRRTLGNHVTQAGSYVGPDSLRFDFTHGKALTTEELETIERIVNDEALANTTVTTYVDIPIAEARERGAMALFGEKYGERVRMVEVGDFSRELCGGTHVRSTGEIGLFKILSESSAASGVRRIEAITGENAYYWATGQAGIVRDIARSIKANPVEVVSAVDRLVDQLRDERRKRERAEMAALGGGARDDATENIELASGVALWVRNFGEVDQKIAAQALDSKVAGKPDLVGLVAVAAGGKVSFIAKAGANAVTKGAHAGNLVREVAKLAGGGGGGRPDFATAGGKDASKVDDALNAAAGVLATMLGVSAD